MVRLLSTDGSARLFLSTAGWLLYGLAWLVFWLAFAALSWFQPSVPVRAVFTGSAPVVLPAAILGAGVVRGVFWLDHRIGSPRRRLMALSVGGVLYPVLWLGSTNLLNNVIHHSPQTGTGWREPPVEVVQWHAATGLAIYLALIGLALTYSAERRRSRAEWRLLQRQLSPHFLFNNLHTLFALAQVDPAAGEVCLDRLASVLRYGLGAYRENLPLVSLEEELTFTENYLALERARLGDRLRWDIRIDAGLQGMGVPPMLLQPLVENAVRYAAGRQPGGCTIRIRAQPDAGHMRLEVADDGPGCVITPGHAHPGIGLRATRARVEALSPMVDTYRVSTAPGQGFAVTLRLPANRLTPRPATSLPDVPVNA